MPDTNGSQNNGDATNAEQKPALSWSAPVQKSPAPAYAGSKENNVKTVGSPRTQSNRKGILYGSAAVLALLIAAIVWLGMKSREATPAPSLGGSSADEISYGSTTTAASFSIPSPQEAGMQVVIYKVSVSSPTWVVIYENRNGEPGNALGAKLFTAERSSGTIDLLRGTLAGQIYFAGEVRDDGDHIFSLKNDLAVRGENDAPVLVQFQTR